MADVPNPPEPGHSLRTQFKGVAAGAAPSTEPAALIPALSVAVELWVWEMMDKPWAVIQERARVCGDFIAEHGDDIMFRGHKKGDTAKAFNMLAEGIACLSFAPGGVDFHGCHFESKKKEEGSDGKG